MTGGGDTGMGCRVMGLGLGTAGWPRDRATQLGTGTQGSGKWGWEAPSLPRCRHPSGPVPFMPKQCRGQLE